MGTSFEKTFLKELDLFNNLNFKMVSKSQEKTSSTPRVRRKRHVESYNIYIYKVLKQINPEMGLSKKAMSILDSFVNDCFDRIASEAGRLVKANRQKTLSA